MKRTGLLAVLLAACAPVFADEGLGPQRFGIYARLVATDPGGASLMVERADGRLWVFRTDGEAARDLAGLKSGDEVMLTFVNDGPGTNDDDVVRDVELLASPVRAGIPLPFGVRTGLALREAAWLRAAMVRPRETLSASGVDADLAVPGPVILDDQGGVLDTSGAPGAQTTDGLLPGLATPGPVLVAGRNLVAGTDRFVSAVPGTFAQPRAEGNFTPGNVAPNMEDPGAVNAGGALSRPAAETPFTPGVVVPGVRDTAAGRGGTRITQPAVETGFTPGTVAPGVRDARTGSAALQPGRETLSSTGVPAALVAPTAVNTATVAPTAGTVGATTGAAPGATTATGTGQGGVTSGGTPLVGPTAPVTPGNGSHGAAPSAHTGASPTLTPGARSTGAAAGVRGTTTGTTGGSVGGQAAGTGASTGGTSTSSGGISGGGSNR
jgi:hypothetical protein